MRLWTCLAVLCVPLAIPACDAGSGGGDTDTDTDTDTENGTTMVDPSSPVTSASSTSSTTGVEDSSSSGDDPSDGSSSGGDSSSGSGTSTGEGSTSTGSEIVDYEGSYEGEFEGDCPKIQVSGVILFTVDADGAVEGEIDGNDDGPLEGTVDGDGAIETTGALLVAGECSYDGQFDGDLLVEGVWECPDFGCTGTWTAGPAAKK